MFSSWMSGGANPADAAMPYLEQIPSTITPYYQPFIDTGATAGQNAQTQYASMTNDPTAYYNQIMSGYNESDSYKLQQQEMTDAAENTAAASGMSGTEYDQQRQQEITQGLLSADMDKYFKEVMGIESGGLKGEQAMYETGYKASDTLASMLAKNLSEEAGLEYKGTAYENAANPFSSMMNMFAQGLGAYYGSKSGGVTSGATAAATSV